jgi:hypothetical protein
VGSEEARDRANMYGGPFTGPGGKTLLTHRNYWKTKRLIKALSEPKFKKLEN